jgi:peptide/nickel transport system permease protein
MRRLIRRAVHSFLLLVATSVLSFALVNLVPGDFFEGLRVNPQVSPMTVAALRSQYGLDRPFPIRYFLWIRSVAKGEWGFSFAYNTPAGPIVWARARNTLLLTGTATILAWFIAISFGTYAAARPGSSIDLITSGTVSTLLAVPELVLAILLLLFAVHFGRLPPGGMTSSDFPHISTLAKARDIAMHTLLPSACLAAGLLPLLLSHVRSAVAGVLKSPFILAAHGYGIPFRRVLWRHALPAAANPLISLFGFSIGLMMSSSLLVEAVFSWPGLGQLMLEAILQRDFFVIVDSAVLAAGFLIAGNVIADLLLYANDPRIRASY